MKVFKFGGASIKDAASVRNVFKVLQNFRQEDLVIVVSAMGKTTNALEEILGSYINSKNEIFDQIQKLHDFHFGILKELFSDKSHRIYNEVEIALSQLEIITQSSSDDEYNKLYDKIVPFGELISTKIISAFLEDQDYSNEWLDARKLVRTDTNFRFARVDWEITQNLIKEAIKPSQNYVVQGFIGSDRDFNPTTLGREGSDYTASIFAFSLDADEVIIWKDVPGILNGDPKIFSNTQLLHQMSFKEAIELAYYGASVIHPKTIQPLRKKGIPLFVRSFLNPENPGTRVGDGLDLDPFLPCFIKKENQALITISTTDLAFIVEDHLSMIYKIFHDFGVRVNLSQNTAVSTSFCINNDAIVCPKILNALQLDFTTSFNTNASLYTVRHYDEKSKMIVKDSGKVLLEQISRNTYQVVTVPLKKEEEN